ncbi:hypothetical protein PC121_g10937 [Phytophthora cactorum]|nr:hypothetical protein PC120_g8906 [Phytophthora cactorum]KAG3066212.1 hypothetical protein PC121_g10937 [Phytophthora cactorum]
MMIASIDPTEGHFDRPCRSNLVRAIPILSSSMDPNLRAPEWAVSFERDKNGELRRIQRLVRDIQQGQRNILKEVRRSRQAIERMGHQLARIDARLIRMEARQIRS